MELLRVDHAGRVFSSSEGAGERVEVLQSNTVIQRGGRSVSVVLLHNCGLRLLARPGLRWRSGGDVGVVIGS